MKKTAFFVVTALATVIAVALSSCQKEGANPSAAGNAAAKANLTVGLPGVLAVWVTEPSIPYTDDIKGDKPVENQYVRGFAINGYGYALGTLLTNEEYKLNSVTKDLWQWDATAGSWSKKASFPGNALYLEFGSSFVIGDNAYVYTVDNNFYRYNQPSNVWTTLTPPPGKIDRSNAAAFSINGNGYFGLGMSGSGTIMSDFMQFDPSTNGWTFMHTFPGTAREGASCFAIDGKGYVVGGRTGGSTYSVAVWQYDPTADHWTQMKNFPGTSQYMAATGVGTVQGIDVGFIAGSESWQYDPADDGWVRLGRYPGTQNAPGGFAIQNGFYICSIGCVAYKWYD